MSEHDPRGHDETAPIQPQPGEAQHEAPEPVPPTTEQPAGQPVTGGPVTGEPVDGPPVGPAAAGPTRTRFRDRSWPLPAVVVVALVAVILGGIGGAALAATSNHQDVRQGPGFGRFHGGPGMMRPGMGGRGPGQRGQFNNPYGFGPRHGNQQPPQFPRNQQQQPTPATPTPSS